jgi:hypothetical protein
MLQNFRSFEAGPDPFGQKWQVEFRWIQNAITIRHADAVDVKFFLRSGETLMEKVIGIPHPVLLRLSAETGAPITDPWVVRLAATHLSRMIETGEDLEKTLITPTYDDLLAYTRAAAARP